MLSRMRKASSTSAGKFGIERQGDRDDRTEIPQQVGLMTKDRFAGAFQVVIDPAACQQAEDVARADAESLRRPESIAEAGSRLAWFFSVGRMCGLPYSET
jgi:hypothetical protein